MRGAVPLLAGVVLAATGCGEASPPKPEPPYQHFRSRPDLKPPPVRVLTRAHGTAPGYIFVAPKGKVAQAGPLILDNQGQVVWFRPLGPTIGVTDFRAQRYDGRPVLTWWRGRPPGGGEGHYTIFDDSYRPLMTLQAGNGLVGDVHEFLITPRGTALIIIYNRERLDLSSIGGPKDGRFWDGVVQELDIATRRVLLEWHTYPQIGIRESYSRPPKKQLGTGPFPYDYVHLNSIDVDTDGNLLVTARNTYAVYKVNRRTGKVMWRLGGTRSDFAFGPGARFAWQHDARRQPDGTITLFDNEAEPKRGPQSRVLVLRVNERTRRATLVRTFVHTPPLLAGNQGNAQFLPNGNVFVGWGQKPYVTEFDRSGRVLLDLRIGGKGTNNYRAYRLPWVGRPDGPPAVAVSGGTVYVSWNGATRVKRWRVVVGGSADDMGAVGSARKKGFETAIRFRPPPGSKFLAVEALDRRGEVLGVSRTVELP